MDLMRLKKEIVDFVAGRKNDFAAIAEELYNNPETGLNEVRSSALLAAFLEKEGFRLERGIAGLPTAFRAETGAGGPVIALIAEMDALPVMGHACGHNVIAAAAVGAATALRRVLPPEAARIVVFGTPAEEQGIGKVDMIAHGAFDGVEFALMVHPSSRRYVIKHFLGLTRIRFIFTGKPAHAAAYPEEGINALDGVIQTFNGINALRQQLRQDVRVHGIITEGGVAPNIIPERAAAYFYVRADDLAEMERVKNRLVACAEGAALATGCRLEVEEDPRIMAPLKVNRTFSALYSAQLAYLGLQESENQPDKNKGSSDIGNVSQVVPTIHPHVPIGDGINIHSEAFARATVSEKGKAAVAEGATALALTAAELVARPELREEIRQEFRS
ncbi:M20 family metallopeptidase [Geobacter benzoatilyticus]|jgi:amidohydrolase|uniref:Peptidase M20 domain-containing protein 2 n=1 Tax=Geobacter benzoatilyticus TaxID=2815309 RepID=A0ABX7Q7B2_9BACT|nr:M20 family metallopeptidase [Geobacter benzoatilyticus]QSV46928.1 M20 family metallopeptidase [Geobacter benzoatilyticus]